MRDILNGSFLVRGLTAAAGWIDRQWERSRLAGLLTRSHWGAAAAESSVFARLWDRLHGGWCAVFRALRLDRLFAGSVLTRLCFWCGLAAALAPLVPTMLLLALVLAGYVSFAVTLGMERDYRLVYSAENVFIYLFAFIYLLCTLTSVTPAGSLQGGLLTTAFVLFAIVFMNAVRTERETDRVVTALICAGALVACYGIFQAATGMVSETDWIDEAKFETLTLRVYSTLENPNVLAEYLLLITPLAASSIFTEREGWKKLLGLAATGAMVVCMVLTYSRGGWLGLIAAVAVFLVILDRRFIVLGVIGAAALLFVLPQSILQRFASIRDLSDSSTSYRISIWLATLLLLKDYWFCGIGTGTAAFGAVYPAYSFNAVSAPHAHNLYLQVLCECGVVGFAVLMAVIVAFYKTCAGGIAGAGRKKRLRLVALIAGMTGFLVQSFTDYSFYNYRVMFLFWIMAALAVVIARSGKEDAA